MLTKSKSAVASALSVGVFMVLVAGTASAQWGQVGYDIGNFSEDDEAGRSVSLSADGFRIAIGVPLGDFLGSDGGEVHVFDFSGGYWTSAGNPFAAGGIGEHSGYAVALSADGLRVAAGSPASGTDAGTVRIYEWLDPDWVKVGVGLVGESSFDEFGSSVALSADGSRVAAGAPGNDSGGINAGAVRVFRWAYPSWLQVGDDLDGEYPGDQSGFSVSLSADGSRVAIGAPSNSESGTAAGHVRVFEWFFLTSTWLFVGDDIDGEAPGDRSGASVSLSGDGSRIAIGAPENDGAGTGSGHVRVFEYVSPDWVQLGADIDGEAAGDLSGTSVSLSADGSRVVIGSPNASRRGVGAGHIRVFEWEPPNWVRIGSELGGSLLYDSEFGTSVSLSAHGDVVAGGAPFGWGWDNRCGLARVYAEWLFADDFESGNTSDWSVTVP